MLNKTKQKTKQDEKAAINTKTRSHMNMQILRPIRLLHDVDVVGQGVETRWVGNVSVQYFTYSHSFWLVSRRIIRLLSCCSVNKSRYM